MAFQSVPQCAEAVVEGTVNGVAVVNVLTFAILSSSYTQADIDDLASAVDAWFATEVLPNLSNQCTYNNTHVRGLENVNDFEADDATGAGAGGTAANLLPGQVTFAVKYTTGLTGRSARGRSYIWGLPVTILGTNENMMATGAAQAFADLFAEIPTYVNAEGWNHVVVSRFTGGAQRPSGIYFPITGYGFTDERVDTQRRRLS